MSDNSFIIAALLVVCVLMVLEINSLIRMMIDPLRESAMKIKKSDRRKSTYQIIISRKDYAGARIISVLWIISFSIALGNLARIIVKMLNG